MVKGQSGLEKWEILKFPLFSCFSHFWLSQANRKTKEAHLRDSHPLDGSSQWCEWQFPHSKKILWFCFRGVSEVRGCPENTCPKKIFFFQKISLSMMPQHISRWIWVVSFSFLLYDKKREKCQFSDFVILTKKIGNNVFCKSPHWNLQKILSILGTWISQIPLKMTDLLIYWFLTPPHLSTL